jgi:hypothetical protein
MDGGAMRFDLTYHRAYLLKCGLMRTPACRGFRWRGFNLIRRNGEHGLSLVAFVAGWRWHLTASILRVWSRADKERRAAFDAGRLVGFSAALTAVIKIIEERGERIKGAIQPDRTIAEIRERLLNG